MLSAMTTAWQAVSTYVVSLFGDITGLFWDATANSNAGGLTFIGILSCITVGISIMLLVFNITRSFLVAHA